MSKEIKLKDVEYTLSQYEEIDEPIIVKREEKSDVVILSLKDYKEKLLEIDVIRHLKKAEDDIDNDRVTPADEVFRNLREKYEY